MAGTELSIAHQVREFVRSLQPGDTFTSKEAAEAIGFEPRKYKTRPNTADRGPVSGPLFDCRMTGAISVIKKDSRNYVYKVIDPSKVEDMPTAPKHYKNRIGCGEGRKSPNRVRMADLVAEAKHFKPTYASIAEKVASNDLAVAHNNPPVEPRYYSIAETLAKDTQPYKPQALEDPCVPVHEAKVMGVSDTTGYVRIKINIGRVLASISTDVLFEELKRRMHGQRDAGTKI